MCSCNINMKLCFNMNISTYKTSSFSVPFLKKLFLLTIVLGSVSLVIIVFCGDPQIFIKNYTTFYRFKQNKKYSNNNIFYSDDAIREMGEAGVDPCPACAANPLLGSNTTHIWVERDNLPHYNLSTSANILCCYKSFYRPNSVNQKGISKIDDRVKYNPCRYFSASIQVNDEFVRVNCDRGKKLYESFFLFAREKKISVKTKTDLPYNILIMGIDAVSRLNLHRTMPKTVKILNKLGAVELLRYNKVGDNTFPNLIPLLVGKDVNELKKICWQNNKKTFDNCSFIWKQFKQAGFATAYGEDYSRIGTFNFNNKRGFAASPTDYYLRTFMVEAEASARAMNKGNSELCLNDKYFYKVLLDYVADLTALSTRKLFGIFWESTMSHDNLNYPMVMDNDYTALFEKMYGSGYLNKSIIFFISDHGLRCGKFRKTRQGFLEERLPFLFALVPTSFRKNFSEAYKNLKRNVQRLTTPFDVHATLSDLINLHSIDNSRIIARTKNSYTGQRSISLFLPIPENRMCKSAAIDAHWCVDYRNAYVNSNSSEAREAIKYAVLHLNSVLKNYTQCAELTFAKVLFVTRLLTTNSPNEKSDDAIELIVSFSTNPGGGEFEATLGRQGGPGSAWIPLGPVSRLNVYGNQSYCVHDNPDARLYCYCTTQY